MICLSKNLNDEYVNMFAKGSNLPLMEYADDPGDIPILIRSIMKRDLIFKCWIEGRTFFYMDSGYLGNYVQSTKKYWHRIVKNNLQHSDVIDRPDDRWQKLNYNIYSKKKGTHILLVPPSEKPCKFYGIGLQSWIKDTIKEIKRHTDRPIIVREKSKRPERLKNPIWAALDNCHALVTYQSVAAIESVLYGVPAITLAPTAADPVCDKDISLIENLTYQPKEKIEKFAHHLAYCQYNTDEFRDGTAWRMLNAS